MARSIALGRVGRDVFLGCYLSLKRLKKTIFTAKTQSFNGLKHSRIDVFLGVLAVKEICRELQV